MGNKVLGAKSAEPATDLHTDWLDITVYMQGNKVLGAKSAEPAADLHTDWLDITVYMHET